MKNKSYLVFWEMVLILASVLVFRSVWLLLDRIEWMSRPAGLWTSLTVGVTVVAVALATMNRDSNDEDKRVFS